MLKRFFEKIFKLFATSVIAVCVIALVVNVFASEMAIFSTIGVATTYFVVCFRIIFRPQVFPRLPSFRVNWPRLKAKPPQEKLTGPKKALEFFDGQTIQSIPRYIELYIDYINSNGSTFKSYLGHIIIYCRKFINKKELLDKTLLSSLDKNELSFIKFSTILSNIEDSVARNLNDVLIRLHAFDEEEYEMILNSPKRSNNYEERLKIFQEYIAYIDASIEFIDGILLKMDKLQLETSKIKSMDIAKIENLQTVKDIDNLINNMKYYKV
ncbi:MAG: hypothetical protein LBT38_10245 [Deltaproteobacteria bacterium]|jgi:hypothetical protein|nr:hypothetical protein [Deltaproteobacteria bacterium]